MLVFLANFILSLIGEIGYGGIFVLMMFDSGGIPFPSEITMPFSGFLASRGDFIFLATLVAGVAGSFLGASILYSIGRFGGRRLAYTYGKLIFISQSRLQKFDTWFSRYGAFVVFVGQMIPGVRSYVALPAGISATSFAKFAAAQLSGALLWTTFLSGAGFLLGERWIVLGPLFHKFEILIIVFLVLAVAGYIIHIRVNYVRSRTPHKLSQ